MKQYLSQLEKNQYATFVRIIKMIPLRKVVTPPYSHFYAQDFCVDISKDKQYQGPWKLGRGLRGL